MKRKLGKLTMHFLTGLILLLILISGCHSKKVLHVSDAFNCDTLIVQNWFRDFEFYGKDSISFYFFAQNKFNEVIHLLINPKSDFQVGLKVISYVRLDKSDSALLSFKILNRVLYDTNVKFDLNNINSVAYDECRKIFPYENWAMYEYLIYKFPKQDWVYSFSNYDILNNNFNNPLIALSEFTRSNSYCPIDTLNEFYCVYRKLLDYLINKYPYWIDLYERKAKLLENAEYYEESINYRNSLISREINVPHNLEEIIFTYLICLKDTKNAIQYVNTLLNKYSDSCFYSVSSYYYESQKYKAAVEYINKGFINNVIDSKLRQDFLIQNIECLMYIKDFKNALKKYEDNNLEPTINRDWANPEEQYLIELKAKLLLFNDQFDDYFKYAKKQFNGTSSAREFYILTKELYTINKIYTENEYNKKFKLNQFRMKD